MTERIQIRPGKNEIEVWRDIPEYKGYYQVSSFGNVRSLDRYVDSVGGTKKLMKGKIMKITIDESTGYNRVSLWKNSVRKSALVRRLVCSAFHKNVGHKPFVNHIDTVKHNDYFKNLEWVTEKENQDHAVLNGLVKQAIRVIVITETNNSFEYPSIKKARVATRIAHETFNKHVNTGIGYKGNRFYTVEAARKLLNK